MRIALAWVALAGCGERLDPQSEVSKLRVLAIRADHPEAAPDEVVNVTALWADPEGEGRDVGFVWTACQTGPGADPRSCFQPGASQIPIDDGIGVGSDFQHADVRIPTDALAEGDTAIVFVWLVACAGGLPDFSAAMEGEIVCPDDESVVAYKRITVSHSDAPNQNPVFDETLFSGNPWSEESVPPEVPACPSGDCAGYALEIVTPPEAAETYVGETPDGPVETQEELLVSFFSTGGEFDRVREVDEENADFLAAWRAPKESGEVTVWFVLRDGRGGITWAERTVSISP